MIRHRGRGRVHNVTHPRAAVRGYPVPQEDTVKTVRSIETSQDLAEACEQAGARVRSTSKNGYVVRGPKGSATIPRALGYGNGRQNVYTAIRAAGIELAAIDADAQPVEQKELATVGGPSPARMPARVEPRPRPELVPDRDEEPEPQETAVSQDDVDTLLDLVETLTGRLDVVTRRLDAMERQVRGDTGPSPQDLARQHRERILQWFATLPPGMRVPAGVIAGNLSPDDETQASAYRRQVARLVELGQLVQHGGNPGNRGGGHAQYALPQPEQQDTTEETQ